MKPETLRLKKRGQVTIPKSIRDTLNLAEDDQLEVIIENGKIVMQPVMTIAKDQAWYWSKDWQKAECEAQDDIDHNRVSTFNNAEDAIRFLRDED